jgi:hypothetical protein
MYKITFCSMLLVLATATFSQQSKTSAPSTKQEYLQKSKNQKTAGWVLLGGGTVLIGTGFLIGDRKESSFDDAATGVIIGGLGLLATIGSIPLFIASGKNKRKAASVSFKKERFQQTKNSGLVYHHMPAVSLKINL